MNQPRNFHPSSDPDFNFTLDLLKGALVNYGCNFWSCFVSYFLFPFKLSSPGYACRICYLIVFVCVRSWLTPPALPKYCTHTEQETRASHRLSGSFHLNLVCFEPLLKHVYTLVVYEDETTVGLLNRTLWESQGFEILRDLLNYSRDGIANQKY